MTPEMIEALKAMQESGWGVGGRLVEESPDIEANYSLGEAPKINEDLTL